MNALLSSLDWMFYVSSKFKVLEPSAQREDVWGRAFDGWLGHKHVAFKNEIIAFRKGTTASSRALPTKQEHEVICKLESRLTKHQIYWHLDLEFPRLQGWERKGIVY